MIAEVLGQIAMILGDKKKIWVNGRGQKIELF